MRGSRGPRCLGSRQSPLCGEGGCWAEGTSLCAASSPPRLPHRLALQSHGVRGLGLGLGKGKEREQGLGLPQSRGPMP